jgi:hypothetical protein
VAELLKVEEEEAKRCVSVHKVHAPKHYDFDMITRALASTLDN